jgi:hypothetical protein
MHNMKDGHHHGGESTENRTDRELGPYWRRAHRDWRFWVGVVFLSVALIVYVMTVDLSLVPRR